MVAEAPLLEVEGLKQYFSVTQGLTMMRLSAMWKKKVYLAHHTLLEVNNNGSRGREGTRARLRCDAV